MDRYPPQQRSLSRLLADRAGISPDDVWVVFDSTSSLTFGDAYARSKAFARRLSASGAERPRVGIMLRNSEEFLIALHGTMLAGGCALLIDPDLSPYSLRSIFERTRPSALVLDASFIPKVSAASGDDGPHLILTGSAPAEKLSPRTQTWNQWMQHPEGDAAPPAGFARPDDDAMVMFTSGTTGVPKAVVLSHHYAFAYSALISDSLQRTRDDVLSAPLPMFHASGLHMAAHSALHVGCRAHLKSKFSASNYWSQAVADGVTQAALIAEMGKMILARGEPVANHRVRHISAGGLQDRETFERRFGVRILWEAFGMTEVYISPMGLAPLGSTPDSIGMPMDFMQYGVVDESDRLLGPGETGELVLRPDNPLWMFSRYLDDESATSQAWRNGLFHTGDLVSYDKDGLLRFRGRNSDRIRHRGENIDPREIEQAASGFAGIAEVAAYAVASDLGDDDIKLDVIAPRPIDMQALRAWLSERLRPKAVPRYFEQREAFPRTPSFRVRRHDLRLEGVARPGVTDFLK